VVILVLIAGGIGYFAKKVSPFLSQRLKDQVIRSSDSLYHIEFTGLSVNPLTGNISLRGFKLIPDTLVYNELKAVNRAPENIFNLSVPQMELRHAHPWKLLLHRVVKIGDVRFEYPLVRIMHQDLFPSDTTQSIEMALANLISGPLNAIYIDRMDLDNITISYENKSNPTAKGFFLQKADLILRDFYIDTTTVKDTTRIFYAKDLWLHLVNLKMPTADSLYVLNLKDVVYSAQRQNALVKDLSVKPRYSESAFDKKVGHQQDRINMTIDSISLSGLNLLNIIRGKKVGRIRKIRLSNADIDLYHNRSLPPKPGIKPLPQLLLNKAAHSYISKDIALVFTLDTVSLDHTDITYRELNPKSERIGTVTFRQLNGSFYHIINDSAALVKNNHFTADFQTMFMGKGKAKAHFDFNLTDPDKAFSYSGGLGYMKANILNKATRYLGMVKIRSGNIHRVHFDFSANQYQAKGSVTLLYDDLSVKILSLDEISGRLKNKGLASLVANLLVLNNNNTKDTSVMRTAQVVYKRDPGKSVFNMMWKSMFTGIKQIVGMDDQASQLKKDLQQNSLIQKIRAKRDQKKNS
jgi:hypothetical protein